MLYIRGVNLSEDKSVFTALSTIFGIGKNISKIICNKLSITFSYKVKDLTELQKHIIIQELENYIIEQELKKNIIENVITLVKIGSYKGIRHNAGLPTRGQRTRTNGKTQKYLNKKIIKSTLPKKSIIKNKITKRKK